MNKIAAHFLWRSWLNIHLLCVSSCEAVAIVISSSRNQLRHTNCQSISTGGCARTNQCESIKSWTQIMLHRSKPDNRRISIHFDLTCNFGLFLKLKNFYHSLGIFSVPVTISFFNPCGCRASRQLVYHKFVCSMSTTKTRLGRCFWGMKKIRQTFYKKLPSGYEFEELLWDKN